MTHENDIKFKFQCPQNFMGTNVHSFIYEFSVAAFML